MTSLLMDLHEGPLDTELSGCRGGTLFIFLYPRCIPCMDWIAMDKHVALSALTCPLGKSYRGNLGCPGPEVGRTQCVIELSFFSAGFVDSLCSALLGSTWNFSPGGVSYLALRCMLGSGLETAPGVPDHIHIKPITAVINEDSLNHL